MSVQTRLQGVSVLVLEDDYYLADDAKRVLERAGARVIGPFSRSEEAVTAAAEHKPSCALLDINLGRGPNFTLAKALRSQGVPIIFLTGYDAEAIPSDLRDVPRLEKPIEARNLLQAVGSARGTLAPVAPGANLPLPPPPIRRRRMPVRIRVASRPARRRRSDRQ